MRTIDPSLIRRAVGDFMEKLPDFVPEDWVQDSDNIALVNEIGDVAIFEPHGSPGVYKGHYFFLSRGKSAISAAKEFLHEIFQDFPIKVILGFTPLWNKGALWLTRHLGFTPIDKMFIYGEDTQVWAMHKDNVKWA